MHLIFAIILLSIILVARASSSGSKAASDRVVKKNIEDRQQWIFWNKLDPMSEGYDVSSYVNNPTNRDAVLAEVKDCYDTIFEKKPFNQIKTRRASKGEQVSEYTERSDQRRAKLILCAKRGYAYRVHIGPSAPPIEIIMDELDEKVMLWCRDELRKQGKNISVLKGTKNLQRLAWAPTDWKSCPWLAWEREHYNLIELD